MRLQPRDRRSAQSRRCLTSSSGTAAAGWSDPTWRQREYVQLQRSQQALPRRLRSLGSLVPRALLVQDAPSKHLGAVLQLKLLVLAPQSVQLPAGDGQRALVG